MKTTVIVVFSLLMAFLAFGFIVRASDPLTREKDGARDAIAYCDKGWNDELTPMDQRRFIRGVCDKLRGDYTEKYGRAP